MTAPHQEHYARAAPAWQDDYDPAYWGDEYAPFESSEHSARFWVTLFLICSLLACVIGSVLVPSGLGFVVGLRQLQEQNHESAIQHFNRGLGFLAENYPELAYTEFQIAAKYDPGYEPVQQKLREMQEVFGRGTPAPQTQEERIAQAIFDEARDLVAKKEWSDAITRLEQLRTLKADFRAPEASALLYQAYVASGKEAVTMGQIQLARERFDAALAIRNDDPEVVRQRDLAVLYLDGQQAVGYNWQTAIQKFSTLYQKDPNYDDIKKRLYDAYVQYGDLYAKQNAPCPAVNQYDGALAISKDAPLQEKRAQTMALCRKAVTAKLTPTPIAPTGAGYTWAVFTDNTKPCTGTGDVTGTVRDALDRAIANVAVGYYADGIPLTSVRTNANGEYRLIWGRDPGLFHVVILGEDGKTPAGLAVDIQYAGGNSVGCHWIIDWHRLQ
jgi:tetratricopeptide (TPR) repeat protein